MSGKPSVVDASDPRRIAAAIKKVKQTPGLRIRTGSETLWRVYQSPGHTLSRAELEKDFGALDLHFGWFCRRVAEELGAEDPDTFALVDSTSGPDRRQRFTLRPSVVAAFGAKKS